MFQVPEYSATVMGQDFQYFEWTTLDSDGYIASIYFNGQTEKCCIHFFSIQF